MVTDGQTALLFILLMFVLWCGVGIGYGFGWFRGRLASWDYITDHTRRAKDEH